MTITLDRWQAQLFLEALRVCDKQWFDIARASDDEDVQADYGNDLTRLHMLQEYFEREAVKVFDPKVAEFSRKPLTTA